MNIPTSQSQRNLLPSILALQNRENTTAFPPRAPSQQRERMLTPGNPRAEINRPDHSPGRIPISAPFPNNPHPSATIAEDDTAMLEDLNEINKRVNNSREIHLLRAAGFIHDKSSQDNVDHKREQVELESNVQKPTTEDRTDQKFTVNINVLQQRQDTVQKIEIKQPKKSDPLALDLDGNGLETTGLKNGIYFDIDGDGITDRTSFISGGDAFVALDRNENGIIDSGKELFGDQNGDMNGYEALSRYDNNLDGVIDKGDAIFNQLRLLTVNSEGTQQLRTLNESGISSISVNYANHDKALNQYDSVMQISTFERDDGSKGDSGDILLGYNSHA